jgi:hypothetical protein
MKLWVKMILIYMESQTLIQLLDAIKQITEKRVSDSARHHKTNSDTPSLTLQALLIASFLLLSWVIVMCTFKMLTSDKISSRKPVIPNYIDNDRSSPMMLYIRGRAATCIRI